VRSNLERWIAGMIRKRRVYAVITDYGTTVLTDEELAASDAPLEDVDGRIREIDVDRPEGTT
jgi:hypothetical protein